MDNFTNDRSAILVDYIDGNLSQKDVAELESRLATDAGLREELESLRLAAAATRNYGLRQEVSAIHKELMHEASTPVVAIRSSRRVIRYSMSIAAAVFIIFIGFTAYNYFSVSAEGLFKDNYRSYELGTSRADNTRDESSIEKTYRDKSYSAVIAQSPTNGFDEFLRAMSYAELKQNENAIKSYLLVLGDNRIPPITRDAAEYYLALVYLRDKQYDSSFKLLDRIQDNPNHLYHERATTVLLRKLQRLIKR